MNSIRASTTHTAVLARQPRASRLIAAVRRPRPWGLVVAQFYPAAALSICYPLVAATLAHHRVAGVSLTLVLIACAVITPTFAQAVAAPLFLHLEGVRPGDDRTVAEIVLRRAPRSVLITTPLLALAVTGVAVERGFPAVVALLVGGLLLLHVVMAALMVAAYALRAPLLLVVPWTAYVAGLLLDPTELWIAPVLGIVAQVLALAALVHLRRRRPGRAEEPAVPLPRSLVAALRGGAEGLPLWVLPLVVLLTDRSVTTFGFVYLALLPAVVAQQLFFVRVVDPGWRRIDRARKALESRPYAEARLHFAHLDRRTAAGVRLGLLVTAMLSAAVVAWGSATRDRDAGVVDVLLPAAALALLVVMQGYAVGMVSSFGPLIAVGSATLAVLIGCSAAGASTVSTVLLLAALDLGAAAWLLGLRRVAVRRAVHTLFWRGALAQ